MQERAIDAILKNFDNSRDISHVDPSGSNIANNLAGAGPVPQAQPQRVEPRADPRQDPRISNVQPQVPEFIAKTPGPMDILNSVVNGQAPENNSSEMTPAQVKAELEARRQKAEEPAQAPTAEVSAADEVDSLIAGDDAELPTTHPIAENFKKLKKVYKETKEKIKEYETRASNAEAKVKEYETGAAVPEIVQNLENKVAAASKWEKLHNLKASEEYRKEFIEPLNETTDKLKLIAKDYGYEESLVDEALKIGSESQLNGFLADNFDAVGAIEVKQLISKAKDISIKAKAAETEPAAVLERMRQESAAREAELQEQRINKISATAKSTWSEAIADLQAEGKMTEIIHRPDDPEHNEFFVKPILTQAGQEFGKIVTMLTRAGLKELPTDVSKALALMTARAHASSVAVASRNQAVQQLNEMQSIVDRVTNARSPNIGAASGRGSGGEAPAAKSYGGDTTLSTAANLLATVLGNKK